MLTNKRKAQLIITATFIVGIVAGAAGQYAWTHQSQSKTGGSNQEMLDDLTRSIRLSKEQRIQVEQLLTESRQQYQDLRNQMRPQYNAIRDATRKRISSILTPEQQPLYEKWTHDLDTKREKERAASSSAGSTGNNGK